VGVYCAADHCRALSLFFGFGAAAGLFCVETHFPSRNTCTGMSPALTVWAKLFFLYLGLCVGIGVLCAFVAAMRHRRIDSLKKPRPARCGNCGYLLYGLPEPRCPECGEPFDPACLADKRPPNEDDAE
jgi:hypothetical protein